ncbi:MAG: hypothetical protein CVU41_15210 [Chloroflexi bacterium HGW-Chloroflexi-3]|nr:MAG: hypothetical protein CVU41_15210 [Chloroflexi bacterium HGW-Chloroflexi-3]
MDRLIRISMPGLLLATLLSFTATYPVVATNAPDHEPGQLVVKLERSSWNEIEVINQAYGTSTLLSLYNRQDTFLLQAPHETSAEQLVEVMALDPRLEYVELNYFTEDPETGSTDRIYGWGGYESEPYQGQDATTEMDLENAHSYSRGAGTIVAILDSGVQLDHPSLANSLYILGFDFVDNDPFPAEEANGQDEDGDGRVDEGYGHGTHVAGIIHLVAPEASLMPLRVLNSDGHGNVFKTANAILFAAYNGADVINLSLGTPHPSALLGEVVREAAGMGVMVVAAAGNLNIDIKQYPAGEVCAIAVTSVDFRGKKSSFANYGDWIGLAAPGENIYSTFPISGYAWWSGTSMSTPFVSGQAALLRSVDPQLTLDELGLFIGATAKPLNRINPAYRGLLGQGEIDILASLQELAAGALPPPERNVLADCNP